MFVDCVWIMKCAMDLFLNLRIYAHWLTKVVFEYFHYMYIIHVL